MKTLIAMVTFTYLIFIGSVWTHEPNDLSYCLMLTGFITLVYIFALLPVFMHGFKLK